MNPRRWKLAVFPILSAAALAIGGNDSAERPVAGIVPAGALAPEAILVTPRGGELELVPGRARRPTGADLQLSLWAVGGPIATPVLKNSPVAFETVGDAKDVRLRFRVPSLEAREGAMLRLVLSESDSGKPVAEAWLKVVAEFDPRGLRRWCEEHPVSISPRLRALDAAFRAWGVTPAEADAAEFRLERAGPDAEAARGGVLSVHPTGTLGRCVVVQRLAAQPVRVSLELPDGVDFTANVAARAALLAALGELARASGVADDFSTP